MGMENPQQQNEQSLETSEGFELTPESAPSDERRNVFEGTRGRFGLALILALGAITNTGCQQVAKALIDTMKEQTAASRAQGGPPQRVIRESRSAGNLNATLRGGTFEASVRQDNFTYNEHSDLINELQGKGGKKPTGVSTSSGDGHIVSKKMVK